MGGNTLAWYMLNRHLLYLYVIIEFTSGIVMIVMADNCKQSFDNFDIMPINMAIPQGSLTVAVDAMFLIVSSYGFLATIQSIVGLVGVIFFNRYPLVNFVFGVLTAFLCLEEIILGIELGNLLSDFDAIIKEGMKKLFDSTGAVNETRFQKSHGGKFNLSAVLDADYVEGWSSASNGSLRNRTNVDYLQIKHRCCGLTGREFWTMKIPLSCCPDDYRGTTCVFSVAYSKGCAQEYDTFTSVTYQLTVELFVFSLLSLVTASTCMYLARLKIKYPDGNYKSDTSSSSDDEDNY